MASREYAYDAKKDCVLRVVASSREEADAKIREIIGLEEACGIQYPNGVRGTGETVNEMPVIFQNPDEEDPEDDTYRADA
ncbi:hypothetical protein [Streptomyces anulatus]|uniref:hypothetical protein n=1 Tax=Streptomyces anulatus TaxID=1892 RepID=UPI0034359521